ncbi:hypothetical protein AT6N2_C1555 [Agrobacterium tumefaciens]|nr:hypothetical protein AT6N2_C1555 [Agrobacterium tumefaciens]
MVVDRVPDINPRSFWRKRIEIGRRRGKRLATQPTVRKFVLPRPFVTRLMHCDMGRLLQIVRHLHGENTAALQMVHQLRQDGEMVRYPLENGVGVKQIRFLRGLPKRKIGLAETGGRQPVNRLCQHVVIAIDAGDDIDAVTLCQKLGGIAGAAAEIITVQHPLQRHLGEEIARGSRPLVFEFEILLRGPYHDLLLPIAVRSAAWHGRHGPAIIGSMNYCDEFIHQPFVSPYKTCAQVH